VQYIDSAALLAISALLFSRRKALWAAEEFFEQGVCDRTTSRALSCHDGAEWSLAQEPGLTQQIGPAGVWRKRAASPRTGAANGARALCPPLTTLSRQTLQQISRCNIVSRGA